VSVAETIAELLGEDRVGTGEDTKRFARDWSTRFQLEARRGEPVELPDCVVTPRSADEVAALLAWAHEERTPLIPFGGGSGVVEAIAASGVVVVSLSALNGVLDVDGKSRLVKVQAGKNGSELDSELRAQGWRLGHEPQSVSISTVGGWIATRATGQLSARFGGIEDLLVALEAILPGGVRIRSKTVPRRATGPDVGALMIGSEGTLGIVTEATLRIVPAGDERVDRCIRFDHMSEGVAACRAVAQSEVRPTVVRLYDTQDSEILLQNHPAEERGPLMLLSVEGERAADRAAGAMELAGGRPGNDDLVAHWWAHRNDAVDAFRELMAGRGVLGPHALVDTIEVAGTWTTLRDLYHGMRTALEPHADIVGCHLSHVYPDGGALYFTLASACADEEDAAVRYDQWWDAAMNACLRAHGSISHHHGIGRLRARRLPDELGEAFGVLVAIKTAIDPHRIMNPGALGL